MSIFTKYQRDFGHLEGWLLKPAGAVASYLMDHQKNCGFTGNIMEIGVYKGLFSTLLSLHAAQHETSVFCDTHLPADLRSMIEGANAGTCQFIEKRSSQIRIGQDLPNMERSFRFIHIDGSHSGTDFMFDLRLAETLLQEEGLICVDDFFHARYPQIADAVFHYVRQNPYSLTLILCGYNKAFLTRPMVAEVYLDAIAKYVPDYLRGHGIEGVVLCKSTFPSEINCFGLARDEDGSGALRIGPDWKRETFPY